MCNKNVLSYTHNKNIYSKRVSFAFHVSQIIDKYFICHNDSFRKLLVTELLSFRLDSVKKLHFRVAFSLKETWVVVMAF